MRKLFAMLLALLILTMAGFALAASEWNFDEEYYVLRGYTGTGGDVTVPGEIGVGTVDVIDSGAFASQDITSLVLPDTLLELRQGAINWCPNLTSVTLPESLIVIGAQNLYCCDTLTEVTIPASVHYIGPRSLAFCNALASITFEGVCPIIGGECCTYIADNAVIRVPDDQLAAYQEALTAAGCTADILPSGRNAILIDNADDGAADFVLDASTGTITSYDGFATYLRIPETIDGVPVKAIGDEAFNLHYYLALLELPEGLETIGESAFAWCATLQYVSFPTTLKTIGDNAFANGYKGCLLDLPAVETIGAHAFEQSLIEGVLALPEGLKTIGEGAFDVCVAIEELYLPATVETIADDAFADNWSLTYAYMDGLTLPEMGERVFEGSALADIDLNEHCTKQQMLDMQAYVDALGLNCRVWRNQNTATSYPTDGLSTYADGLMTGYTGEMTHIRPYDMDGDDDTIGLADGALRGNTTVEYFAVPHNDVFTAIGAEAFMDSRIRHVDLFDSVTTIGARAFSGCSLLEELILPDSVTAIGEDAFAGLTGLKRVTILCDASLLPEGSFANCPALTEAYVAKGAIPASLFEGSALSTITLGEDVTAIGEYAFAGTKLTRLVIPADVVELPVSALAGLPEDIDLRLTGDATDAQLAAWNEKLARPWHLPILREGDTRIAMTPTPAPTAAPTPTPEPTATPMPTIDVPAEYVGTWYGVSVEMDGMKLPLADLGMDYMVTIYEDGRLSQRMDGEEETSCCTLEDGVLMTDGTPLTVADGQLLVDDGRAVMILSREKPEKTFGEEAPVDESATLADFLGTWRCVRVSVDGLTLSAEIADMTENFLVVSGDTCDYIAAHMQLEDLPCRMDGHLLICNMLETDYTMALHTDGTISLHKELMILWYERTDAVPSAEPADSRYLVDTRYVMTSMDMNGMHLTAAMMGGMEYSLILHADGSADFVLAGTALPMLTWSEGKVAADNGEQDGIIIDYYGQKINLVLTEVGLDMDYFGTMLIHFEPEI